MPVFLILSSKQGHIFKTACHNSTSSFTFNGACNKDDGIFVGACSPGYMANQSCIIHDPANYKCSPCSRGSFQPYHNNCTNCSLCSKCGPNQKVLSECTIVNDTVCTSSTPSSVTAEDPSHTVPGTAQSTRSPDVPVDVTNTAPTDQTSSDLNVTPGGKYVTEACETQVVYLSNPTHLILIGTFASAFTILLFCIICSGIYKICKKNRKQRNHDQNGNNEHGTQAHQTGRQKPEAKSPVNPAGEARQNGAAGEVSANGDRHPGHGQSVDTQSATTPGSPSNAENSFEIHPNIPGKKCQCLWKKRRKGKEGGHAREVIPLMDLGKGKTTKGAPVNKNVTSCALDTHPTSEDRVRSNAMKVTGAETQDFEDGFPVHSIPAENSSVQAGIVPSASDPQFLAGATNGAKEGKTTPAETVVMQGKMAFTKRNPHPSISGEMQKASSDVPEDDSEESDQKGTHFADNGRISSLGPIRLASGAILEEAIPGHEDQSRSIEGRILGSDPVTFKFLQYMANKLSRKIVEEMCREWDLDEHIIEDQRNKFDLLKEVKMRKGHQLTYAQVIDCLIDHGNRNAADKLIEKFNVQL